jgi:hypothetical protein
MSAFVQRKSMSTASYFLYWLKAASVTFGVGDLLGEPLQIGSQGFRFKEGLGVFGASHVALVGVLVRRADGDDAIGDGHL